VGAAHVAIGTDVQYRSSCSGEEEQKIPPRPRGRNPWGYFWPPTDPVQRPEWNQEYQIKSLAWTNWPLFTVGLVQRGHSDADIQKIIGGNVVRIARAAWEARSIL